MSGLQ
ncbi:galectin-10, partial [Daubentonia madagascariensis]